MGQPENPLEEFNQAADYKSGLKVFASEIVDLVQKMENHFENVKRSVKNAALANIFKGLQTKNKEQDKIKLQARITKNWHKLINKESRLKKSLIEVTDGKYKVRIAGNSVVV